MYGPVETKLEILLRKDLSQPIYTGLKCQAEELWNVKKINGTILILKNVLALKNYGEKKN